MSDDKQGMDNGVVKNEDDAREALSLIVESAGFETLALLPTTRKSDGKKVFLIAAVVPGDREGKRGNNIYPLAALFDEDPFEVYNPPEGGRVIEQDAAPMDRPGDVDATLISDDEVAARMSDVLGMIEQELGRRGVSVSRLNVDADPVDPASESKEDYSR